LTPSKESSGVDAKEVETLRSSLNEMTSAVKILKDSVDELEQERDHALGKLSTLNELVAEERTLHGETKTEARCCVLCVARIVCVECVLRVLCVLKACPYLVGWLVFP
jgi:hypothetical protein